MDCTRLNLEKRIVYRGLVLLLLLALVWQCGLLFPALGHRVWAESLVPGPRRRHSRCYSRYRQACWDFWMRRVQVLLCRVGLVTGLLLWSGCAQRQPAGKRRRWMYVYLAVDVYTYDLLHIDIYPYNGKAEARAFLQALKAKGYQPRVIITDMNQDCSEPIRQVFSKAVHHECVFHALQWAQRLIKAAS